MTFSACPRFLEPEMKEQGEKLTAFILMLPKIIIIIIIKLTTQSTKSNCS